MTEGAGIGTAIVSYIEPHAGCERDFNRWYERDHFPAAVLAGPGAFAGARFVATSKCKRTRRAGTLFGDPRQGSYLSVAWLLPGTQPEWDAWIPGQMASLVAEDRMFAGRDHLHTAVYEHAWNVTLPAAPPALLMLDRANAGVIAIAVVERPGAEPDVVSWAGELLSPALPVVVALRRRRLLASTLGEPAPHLLLLAFVSGDVFRVWKRVSPDALDRLPGEIGFAGPFLSTVPGTDTYVDDL
jgi:hypothetical protein